MSKRLPRGGSDHNGTDGRDRRGRRRVILPAVLANFPRRGLVATLPLLALLGCSQSSMWHGGATSEDAHLFQEAYSGITNYYIEPVTPASLALAGLGKLSTVDADLRLEHGQGEVVLHDGSRTTHFPEPAARDADAWGKLTDAAINAARGYSPVVASLSQDHLDELVIDGSVATLDRFSHYSAPDMARERRAARDGFGGIGVALDTSGPDIRVSQVQAGTPAAAAGLRVNDRITAIDGIAITEMPREQIVEHLRGPVDSNITLAVKRSGGARDLVFSLQRAHIVPATVTLEEKDGIAHLRVTSFNQQTAQSAGELLQQAHRDMGEGLRGVILDLRGNPGGLLDQSVEVASLFLDGGPVTSTVGRVSESIQYFSAPHREAEHLPLVVLVNGGSASASEIVASALQDTGRAVVVGSASYGKGTVQNVLRMPNEGELTITWARLITPGGYVLHQHGVVPTVCTAKLPDDARSAAAAVWRSTSLPTPEAMRARAQLSDADWQKLRDLCPGEREDRAIEMLAARKLLADPTLYARALGSVPVGGERPVSTARVSR
jgi:carboxyl-terminal processing protease